MDAIVGVSGILDSVRTLVLAVVMIMIALVTVLMERSFITKERGEIAILKAVGFQNSVIVKWHTIRFGIVSIVSTVIALLLSKTLTHISVGPVFKMMGADYGIRYEIVPMQVYVLYPLMVLAITVISAWLTALYTKTIKAAEDSCME